MNIIALVGPGNCGKTTVINLVYNYIKMEGGVTTNKIKVGGNENDFSDLVLWKGKRIFFFSMGDIAPIVKCATKNFFNQNCDILICACNNQFKSPLKEFRYYDTVIINKEVEPNQISRPAVDEKYSQDILGKILEII